MDLSQDDISNMEFGLDYEQLGTREKEWVDDEIDEAYSLCRNGKEWSKCNCC
jgi:hypothetical protein